MIWNLVISARGGSSARGRLLVYGREYSILIIICIFFIRYLKLIITRRNLNYLFELGRNPEISKLEILSVLHSHGIVAKITNTIGSQIFLETDKDIFPTKLNQQLAGTLKIAEKFFESIEAEPYFLDGIDYYFPKNFNLYISFENIEDKDKATFQEKIKKYIKSHRLRGSLFIIDEDKLKGATSFLHDSEHTCEVMINKIQDTYFYSIVRSYTDNKEYHTKDEQRPKQMFSHGTSFRLAKMMVNILGLEEGKTLVDPFCGTGTFLIEGLLNKNNVVGIDIEHKLVNVSEKNVEWAIKKYKLKNTYKLIIGDASGAEFKADGCVFEPYMGPFVKDMPKEKQAKKTLKELYALYGNVFNNLYTHLEKNSLVVCIIPELLTSEGKVLKIPKDVFSQTGFKPIDFKERYGLEDVLNPIKYETPEGSKINRRLWVVEKM